MNCRCLSEHHGHRGSFAFLVLRLAVIQQLPVSAVPSIKVMRWVAVVSRSGASPRWHGWVAITTIPELQGWCGCRKSRNCLDLAPLLRTSAGSGHRWDEDGERGELPPGPRHGTRTWRGPFDCRRVRRIRVSERFILCSVEFVLAPSRWFALLARVLLAAADERQRRTGLRVYGARRINKAKVFKDSDWGLRTPPG